MFGLPWETTLIMAAGTLLWVVYTIVFYLRTSSWNIEDADYDHVPQEDDDDGRSPGRGGELR